MRTHVLAFAVALTQLSCAAYFLASSKKGFEANHLKTAAFDLSCPEQQLVVTELAAGETTITPGASGSGTVIGVTGCDRKATYTYIEAIGWVAQSASSQR